MNNRFELIDLFEPVFDEVCRLNILWNQSAGSGGYTIESLKGNWLSILRKIYKRVSVRDDPRLLRSYEESRLAVVHFVDEFIISQKLAELSDWRVKPLATDPNTYKPDVTSRPQEIVNATVNGGAAFFVHVEKDILVAVKEKDLDAKERLALYLTCIEFGFKGKYHNNPAGLEDVAARIHEAIPDYVHLDFTVGIFRGRHKAYVVPMPPKPTRWVPWVVVSLVILSVALLVGYFAVYYGQYGELRDILHSVTGKK